MFRRTKYCYTQKNIKTGDQDEWWRDEDTPLFWKFSRFPNKKMLPKLGLWSSGSNQHLICADFDEIPPPFGSFDDFHLALESKFGKQGIVLRSPSDKVKALFLIEKISPDPPTLDEALDCLNQIGKIFSAYADRKGLKVCYLTEPMAKLISAKLPSMSIVHRILGLSDESKANPSGLPTSEEASHEPKPIVFYEGSLPDNLNRFIHHYKNRSTHLRESLLRFIIAKPKKALKTIDLPITWIAEQLGTSKQNISIWIKWLLDKQWLQIKSNGYKKGSHSKSYKVSGPLKDACVLLSGNNSAKGKYRPPKFIRDGEWDDHLYFAMNHFNDEFMFRGWFQSLPGHQLKNREGKMLHQIKEWHKRQNRLRSKKTV